MTNVTLTKVEYERLLAWAKVGTDASAEFYEVRTAIDRRNAVSRHTLMVRWQEVPAQKNPVPVPATYPELQTTLLEMTRPITRDDVLLALVDKPTTPALIYVTADVTGHVGWYELDSYPF